MGICNHCFRYLRVRDSGVQPEIPRPRHIYSSRYFKSTGSNGLGYFDFVLESYTLQVLPPTPRRLALHNAANLVKEGGLLLLIARGRGEDDPEGKMPWPLTRRELEEVSTLRALSFEDYWDREIAARAAVSGSLREALYQKRSRV